MLPLQFITHHTTKHSYIDSARIALEGGCQWIQLRMKDSPIEEIEATAIQIQSLCKQHEAVFIINDQVELVKKLKADGVHLGKNDMPIAEARHFLGEAYLIGGTANTFEQAMEIWHQGADYIGCGPFRFTTTKENLSPILGLEGYRNLIARMNEAGNPLPVVAIGGITYEDIPAIMSTGVHGIALSGAILNAEDPISETRRILALRD